MTSGARSFPRFSIGILQPMIHAAIFDMDGLLIDSEPLWRLAVVEVLTAAGVPLTAASVRETMGLRTDEVVAHWFARHPWPAPHPSEVVARINLQALKLIRAHGAPLPGAREVVALLAGHGIPLAIASSSPSPVIAAVLARLGLADSFLVVQSAEHESQGKPHPAVYLAAARRLDIPPSACLAFEDAPHGVAAAKAAGMTCIAVPEPAARGDPRFGAADLVLSSLADFRLELLDRF